MPSFCKSALKCNQGQRVQENALNSRLRLRLSDYTAPVNPHPMHAPSTSNVNGNAGHESLLLVCWMLLIVQVGHAMHYVQRDGRNLQVLFSLFLHLEKT